MVEQLQKLYPNSFDGLGSLKGEYNIRIDPTVKQAQHVRQKVPIKSKEAIDKELDFLIEEEIITEQVEPTPWVSSVTFPRKLNRDAWVCLDPSNLNTVIIREHHKPMTVEEITHKLAGATVYTKVDALKAFLQIHLTQSFSLDNIQLTQGMPSLSKDAIQSQNEPTCVPDTDGCHSRAVPRSHRDS